MSTNTMHSNCRGKEKTHFSTYFCLNKARSHVLVLEKAAAHHIQVRQVWACNNCFRNEGGNSNVHLLDAVHRYRDSQHPVDEHRTNPLIIYYKKLFVAVINFWIDLN